MKQQLLKLQQRLLLLLFLFVIQGVAQAARNIITNAIISGDKGWAISGDAPSASAPTLEAIANQATCDGQTISNIAITLGGDLDAVLTAVDNNTGINPTYTFGGTGANRTLTIATVSGQIGATTVTVTATSGFGTATQMFLLELGNKVVEESTVSTLAGSGSGTFANGTGTGASFYHPSEMVFDATGNILVADRYNHRIRQITPDGVVTTFAGSGTHATTNANGTAASFRYPTYMAKDAAGNVYVTQDGQIIRKITPAGDVTTFAGIENTAGGTDGDLATATFNSPTGMAFDTEGNMFIAERSGHRIRKVTPAGVVSTFAGSGAAGSANGVGTAATFNSPVGIAIDALGNLYVADAGNQLIRKITPDAVVSTFAGSGVSGSSDGNGTSASFNGPSGLAFDAFGNLYVADVSNNKIRKITPVGDVSTYAGSGGAGSVNGSAATATFNGPIGLAIDTIGNVFTTDHFGHRIRKITPSTTYTSCNAKPIIGAVANQTTCDGVSKMLNLTVSDTDNDPVTVSATSSNITLVPNANITYNAGTGVLTLTPANGQVGETTIKLVPNDGEVNGDTVYFTLTVNTLPTQVSLSYIAPICENKPDFTLNQGSPAGGVYTINNEVASSFSPGNLQAGSHRVVYTVESENGCVATASQPVTVKAVTSATLAAFAPICLNADPLTLSGGQPLGGKYSGTSVVNGVFTPSLAATGTHTLTYSFTNTHNCTDTAQAAIEVMPAPEINLTAVAPLCINETPFALAEKTNVLGTYSGTGVSNNVFSPKVAGVGKTTVTVVVAGENGCQTSKSFEIEVKAGTALSFTTLESLCADAAAINLLATPTGGSFNGTGVSGDTFSPAGLAAGKYALVYTYTADNGCVETMSDTVRVKVVPSPVISATAEQFCPAGEVTLSTTEFDSYQWIHVEEPIENANSASLIVNTAGTYMVEVEQEGCYGLSEAVDITAADSLKPVITFTGGGSICAQQAVTLGLNGQYTSYKWYNNDVAIEGASAATYDVSVQGSYSVVVSDGICSGSSAPVVLSATAPVIITTSGQSAICQGSGVTLSASAGNSYQWYKDGQALTGGVKKTYQATQAGTYYVHVSDGAGCEANSADIAVTVLPLPEPSLTVDGKTEFCFGENTRMFTQSFASYRWKRNGVTIAGATFESYQASQSGSYSVQVVNEQGCKATSAAQTITVHALPQASITPGGTTVICEGTAFELMAAPATSYQWYNGEELISGATVQNLSITQTGAYRVLVGSMNGCENLSAAAIVKVNPAPEVPTVIFVDGSLTSSVALNYQWFKDDVLLSGANQQTLALTSNGSYHVVVTGSNGCSSRSATSNVVSLAIDKVAATAKVMVFPNPIGNQFTIESSQAGSYQLVDITGQRILKGDFARGATAVQVHELACGVYQLLIQSEGTSPQVVRLVK